MRFALLRKWMAFCLISALFSPQLLADRLVMKNGDVITGNISKIIGGEVYIEPDYAGEFAVDIAEIVSIEADQVFEIELADGQKLEGTLEGGEDGQQTVLVDGSPMTVAMADFAEATEPEEWYDRTSHVDVNMTWNDGNTDSRNNLVFADTRLKLGDHRHLAEVTIRRDQSDGVDTKKQDLLRYSYNWIFNKPWYGGLTGSYERDPIKELDHRYTLGVIMGRDMIDNAHTFLTINAGIGYSEEQYFTNSEAGGTALWRMIYEHDFRKGDLAFFHNNAVDYQLYGVKNAIFKTNTGFRFDIIDDVYTSVSLRYDYETDPPDGNENEDITLAIGVGAEF